jgi:phenylpropionate dioxygenase-like ring-hydroxylating dioxygenase large terminal subunit
MNMAAVETCEHLGTGPVPVEPYISPEYFERERERIFRKVWINVGRDQEIPNGGDYFVRDIEAAKASVIIVRGRDNVIRAFHNVCSHRGNRMVWNESGNAYRLTCNFHGWTYALDGELKGVPDEPHFFDLDKKCLGLTPVALEVWEGFIFVNLNPKPENSLAEFLGDFGRNIHGWPFEGLTNCYRHKVEIKCNWKVAMNVFQEGYHVPFIHKSSVPDSAAGPENPFCRPVGMVFHELHSVISLYRNPTPRLNSIDHIVAKHGPGYRNRAVTLTELPRGVNPARSDKWGFDSNTIFPNFVVHLWGNGTYNTFTFWPLTVNTCVMEARSYSKPPKTAGERFGREYNRMVLRSALTEDVATLERVQPMIESGAKSHFILQRTEAAIRHHHNVVEDFVRS